MALLPAKGKAPVKCLEEMLLEGRLLFRHKGEATWNPVAFIVSVNLILLYFFMRGKNREFNVVVVKTTKPPDDIQRLLNFYGESGC